MTALIILIYNNSTNIVDFIRSFEQYNTHPAKYIIVDNGSPGKDVSRCISSFLFGTFKDRGYLECEDGFVLAAGESLPYCTFLRSRCNSGFSGGNNKGLCLAYKDKEIKNVFVVNDDVIFVDDILPKMVRALYTLPKSGMICPISLLPNGDVDMACVRRLRTKKEEFISMVHYVYNKDELILQQHPEYLDLDFIEIVPPIGPSILMKKDVIQKLGGYDDNVFLYHEEYILQKKFSTLNLINYALPKCRLIHIGSVSTQQSPSKFIGIQSIKSTYYFYKNYHRLNIVQLTLLNIFFYLGLIRRKFLGK